MKTIFEHVEHVKGKPHHIRKRVAFSTAAFGAGIIALVWLVGSLGGGAFVIGGSTFADSTGKESPTTTANDTTGQLAGVGAAIPDSTVTPAHIEIVDAPSTAVTKKKAEQTTIPF
ncbi:MAG: hypothetical protein NUV60_02790 [Patescibacteria group bacterium]|nr:hypothetical protein [Patescibacteria group bacterium]